MMRGVLLGVHPISGHAKPAETMIAQEIVQELGILYAAQTGRPTVMNVNLEG